MLHVFLAIIVSYYTYSFNLPGTAMTRATALAINHGGGPLPILGDPTHRELTSSMKSKAPDALNIKTSPPKAIVIVTAHWQTLKPTISNATRHELYYDYYGFPMEAYDLKYDAPGSPEVARQVYDALKADGFEPEYDEKRGK